MTEKKDWEVEYSPEVLAQMEADPELSPVVRETVSRMRQVLAEVQAGRIPDIDTALRSIGMTKMTMEEVQQIKGEHSNMRDMLGITDGYGPKEAMDVCLELFDVMDAKGLTVGDVLATLTLAVAVTAKGMKAESDFVHNAVEAAFQMIDIINEKHGTDFNNVIHMMGAKKKKPTN